MRLLQTHQILPRNLCCIPLTLSMIFIKHSYPTPSNFSYSLHGIPSFLSSHIFDTLIHSNTYTHTHTHTQERFKTRAAHFPVQRDERTGMQRASLGKSGSEAVQVREARAFSSNSLVNTMDMTAAIQYILTAAQSLGSQVYYKRSRMMIYLGLLVYYSAKTSRRRQNGLSYVPKKILTLMLREARGGLKATVGNRVKPDYHFIRIVFSFFLFVSARCLCSLAGYAQKHVSTYWTLWA